MSTQKCPSCKNDVAELINLDEAYRKNLSEHVGIDAPPSVCANCHASYDKKLRTQNDKETRRAGKEASRLNLWRRRVDIMRDARDRFANKDFSGAVVSYEKYLRVIEMIYDVKPNQLKVTFFNNTARAKELVLITSTYWDLIRIYDQSDRFSTRFQQCAEKLVEFLPFTPMYHELVNRIQDHKKIAKHKDVFQKIYKQVQKKKKRCFIATAAFQTPEDPHVKILCSYRDRILNQNWAGKTFTRAYYVLSPPVAQVLDHSPFLRAVARKALTRLTSHLDLKYNLSKNNLNVPTH
jgi:hypothetical protein